MLLGSHPQECEVIARVEVAQGGPCLVTQLSDQTGILGRGSTVERCLDWYPFIVSHHDSQHSLLTLELLEDLFDFRLQVKGTVFFLSWE